jgi:hypothetical protein
MGAGCADRREDIKHQSTEDRGVDELLKICFGTASTIGNYTFPPQSIALFVVPRYESVITTGRSVELGACRQRL